MMISREEYNIRRQKIEAHIQLLEERYAESERREAVDALKCRLQRLENKREAAW